MGEVDLEGAFQGQVIAGQQAAELPQPAGLARSLRRRAADAADADEADAPAYPATASNPVAASVPSTDIGLRLLASIRLKMCRFIV
jgi:hypothetical protein